jgi:hypothetical protein
MHQLTVRPEIYKELLAGKMATFARTSLLLLPLAVPHVE